MAVEPLALQFENNKRAPSKHQSEASFSSYAPNIIIDLVRSYAEVNNILPGASRVNNPKNYLVGDISNSIVMMQNLCAAAEKVFRQEARVLKVQTPVCVFGDTHGNLKDLLMYEKLKWKRGPNCEPANYLFLGDYVDRGKESLEVSLYLFTTKSHSSMFSSSGDNVSTITESRLPKKGNYILL